MMTVFILKSIKLLALPFIPIQDVEQTYDDLLERIHSDAEDLVTYTETTYVRGCPGGGEQYQHGMDLTCGMYMNWCLIHRREQLTRLKNGIPNLKKWM